MKPWGTLVLSLLVVGVGVLLLVVGEPVVAATTALLGVGGVLAFFIERGWQRGDPRTGGLDGTRPTGPYLLLAMGCGAVFAAIGVLFLVYAPVTRRTIADTPVESRVIGAISLVFGLTGLVVGVVRWARARRRRTHDKEGVRPSA